jgi:hypothetical protein
VLFHCKWILSSLGRSHAEAWELAQSIPVTVADIDLAKVPEALALVFPFRELEARQVDEFLAS